MASDPAALVIWRLYDGKAGHDRQSQGLVKALAAITTVSVHNVAITEQRVSLLDYLARRLPFGGRFARPDLIIGAGRRCQWPMLAARRARGGSTIYLMKPQIGARFFDLCVIPRHDKAIDSPTVIVSDGVLNDVAVSTSHGPDGLILVGGPSDHYSWDEAALLRQIEAILAVTPNKQWVFADSRRTPQTTRDRLKGLSDGRAMFTHFGDAPADWLIERFARTDTVWVSSDSVSMMYEALSAGVAVGLLEVPAKRTDRITQMVDDLTNRELVTPYTRWRAGQQLVAHAPLAEAARCAKVILSCWDPSRRHLAARSVA